MCTLKIISCKSAHKSLQGLNQQTVALISGFSTETVQLMQSIYLHLICVGRQHTVQTPGFVMYDRFSMNKIPVMFSSGTLSMQHPCIRYANYHLEPPTIEESQHNSYLSKIQPLIHSFNDNDSNRSVKGDCFLQCFTLQPSIEYTPLVAPLECFITGQIPAVGTTPSSNIHIHHEEPSYKACEE